MSKNAGNVESCSYFYTDKSSHHVNVREVRAMTAETWLVTWLMKTDVG